MTTAPLTGRGFDYGHEGSEGPYSLGTGRRDLTVTDSHGGSGTPASATVTVVDNTPPPVALPECEHCSWTPTARQRDAARVDNGLTTTAASPQ
jgi:hypothetical protein